MIKRILFSQKIAVISYFILGILLFIFAISFTTPLYPTRLYGNVELLTFYENNLQVFNRYFFYISLGYVLFGTFCILFKVTKYLSGEILYPVTMGFSIASVYGAISTNIKLTPVSNFYLNYDYTSIQNLKDYVISKEYFNLLRGLNIVMVIISISFMIIFTLGFIQYLKQKVK